MARRQAVARTRRCPATGAALESAGFFGTPQTETSACMVGRHASTSEPARRDAVSNGFLPGPDRGGIADSPRGAPGDGASISRPPARMCRSWRVRVFGRASAEVRPPYRNPIGWSPGGTCARSGQGSRSRPGLRRKNLGRREPRRCRLGHDSRLRGATARLSAGQARICGAGLGGDAQGVRVVERP